jgi:S-adenosylmethionine:tRNA ribosyltransferase-isomerase
MPSIQDFNFTLPKELIAQTPANPRDRARLLVYRRSDTSITDDYFYNLPDYLPVNTTLVLNKAKVDKCRMKFANLEVFLLHTVNNTTATALVRPGKKFKLGETVQLSEGLSAQVTSINEEGHRTLVFNVPLDSKLYDEYKLTPLPPYIAQNESLSEEYQTIYAQDEGSKAAPTAGLHFTEELLRTIKARWPVEELTLDVGLGTFAPIDDEAIKNRILHEETYSISKETADGLNNAKHITAVGTTTVRALESLMRSKGGFEAVSHHSTTIFIQPGDIISSVNSLITNFHLPSTSLLMMVAAFTGEDELKRIYQHAILEKYRFYSFGDAMLII